MAEEEQKNKKGVVQKSQKREIPVVEMNARDRVKSLEDLMEKYGASLNMGLVDIDEMYRLNMTPATNLSHNVGEVQNEVRLTTAQTMTPEMKESIRPQQREQRERDKVKEAQRNGRERMPGNNSTRAAQGTGRRSPREAR